MLRFLIFLALQFSLSIVFAFGQSATLQITPKKIVYKRTATHISESRRTFEVISPVFRGGNPDAISKIKKQLNFWKVFEMSFKEELEQSAFLIGFTYKVTHNKENLLSIILTVETIGAYPDSYSRYFLFDVRTGRQLEIEDVIRRPALNKLLDRIRSKMRAELQRHSEAVSQLEIGRELTPGSLNLDDLDGFITSERGVTFLYDYQFPHVAKANEPPGQFFFSWREIGPFIKRESLLARFVR